MDVLTFWKSIPTDERDAFAARCNTTRGHLGNVAYGIKPCAAGLAVAIERESRGKVRAEVTCPDVDWSVIRSKKIA